MPDFPAAEPLLPSTSDVPPVMFIHGLWLAASSWDAWRAKFGAAGYPTLAPTWPGESVNVADTRGHAEDQAGNGIDEITGHFAAAIASLARKPIVIGHSFGGLIAQKLLAADVAAAAVAIDSAQIQGVKALPYAQLRSSFPVLGNPANAKRSVTLTPDAFAYSFGNALERSESDELYEHWSIPSPGRPLFQAAFANFQPDSPAHVDTDVERGPLLILAGGKDHTVPESVSRSTHHRYRKARTDNDYVVFSDRGHSLTVDHGWPEVADTVLEWLAEKGFGAAIKR
ncbi:alpha/beta hydrolase [Rhodococcus spongiicola]|uniref:Alpha/beta hydrolase n=1 Tax=Rhodococcus spongiicola TaxID=2487352 RepID=A0A3S3AE66_9NOCA|nr:alpha/beta hydrolase [Rhodococcus spongiicola]RVW02486.1 alpha/beta hydrolase [Rhodococcus spongiicola]